MKVLIILSLVLISETTKPYNCLLEPAYGKCQGSYTAWFYSENENACISFIYSGCGGNHNRFRTEELCIKVCINPLGFDYYGL